MVPIRRFIHRRFSPVTRSFLKSPNRFNGLLFAAILKGT
jgi:hypothetical protein